ncbi:MAG: AmmeMemoRadiSam system protein B [Elusimicrobiales bacterium]
MVRKSVAEGRFYPDNKFELEEFFSQNIKDLTPKSEIIVSPHAGYVYSGKTAAKSFSHIEKDFETAFVIGTAHTVYAKKCCLIKDCLFRGVWGDIQSDDEIIDFLLQDKKSFEINPNAHLSEHSIEVVIPFLNHINKSFKIVPIAVNGEDREILFNAAKKISIAMKKKKSVCVISTDLSHYPPYEIAHSVDNAFSMAYDISITNKDTDYFYLTKELLFKKYSRFLDTVACGFSPMVLGLNIALNSDYNRFKIIECVNSGDVMESDNVVGYLSGIFLKDKAVEYKINLSKDEKKYLLSLAKKSIQNYISDNKMLKVEYFTYPKLNLPFAVFVTLNEKDNLRGCIGSLSPHMLLGDAVIDYAVKAGFEDPRFPPLSRKELDKINMEISILSPLKKISDISEIKENIHGVYIKNGFRSGTYLPQVWEHFKTKEEFLVSLFNEKSGIGYENLNDSEIYIYTVESIKE